MPFTPRRVIEMADGRDRVTRSEGPAATLVCGGCEREIEWCAFCDSTDCSSALCYRCLLFELGESTPQPHAHGG